MVAVTIITLLDVSAPHLLAIHTCLDMYAHTSVQVYSHLPRRLLSSRDNMSGEHKARDMNLRLKLPPEGGRQERERARKAIAIISNYGQEADPSVRTIGKIMNHGTPACRNVPKISNNVYKLYQKEREPAKEITGYSK